MALSRNLRRLAILLLLHPLNGVELPDELFPDLDTKDPELVRLHGIAALYPGRVRFEAPPAEPADRRAKAASVADLPDGIRYIRLYRLDEGLATVRGHIDESALILDFRYLRSRQSGAGLAALLGGPDGAARPKPVGEVPEPIREQLQQDRTPSQKRRHPVVLLTNAKTAGPFEAALSDLQRSGAIIGVGSATAGDTGFFRQIRSGVWVLKGELRNASNESLIPGGFRPRITTGITPEDDYRAYHLHEAGTPLAHLIRDSGETTTKTGDADPDGNGEPVETNGSGESTDAATQDSVLKRGIETVKALRILDRLPR